MLITRRVEFSAAHACFAPDLSEEQNRALYGPSANPCGHGHNFVLEVTLEGEPDPATGMVFDLKRLKDILERDVVAAMDHRFLNREVAPFDRVIPTAENLAREIWQRLAAHFSEGPARLNAVRLYETEDFWVDYCGEAP
jgi:6-pyruvoyltetrahydropterin/6-carboxytetrahydropterin synthase